MSCHQRCDWPGPVTTVCRPVPVTEAGRRLTQQPFEVRPFSTHTETIRTDETPTTSAWPMRGPKARGPRTCKSKGTSGTNWDSSVAGQRHKRRHCHHPLATPTIFQQGQSHEPRQRAEGPTTTTSGDCLPLQPSSRPKSRLPKWAPQGTPTAEKESKRHCLEVYEIPTPVGSPSFLPLISVENWLRSIQNEPMWSAGARTHNGS